MSDPKSMTSNELKALTRSTDTIQIQHTPPTKPLAPTLIFQSYPTPFARTLSRYLDKQLEIDLTADLEDFASGAVNPPDTITIESRHPFVYVRLVLEWMRSFAESGGEETSVVRPSGLEARGMVVDRWILLEVAQVLEVGVMVAAVQRDLEGFEWRLCTARDARGVMEWFGEGHPARRGVLNGWADALANDKVEVGSTRLELVKKVEGVEDLLLKMTVDAFVRIEGTDEVEEGAADLAWLEKQKGLAAWKQMFREFVDKIGMLDRADSDFASG